MFNVINIYEILIFEHIVIEIFANLLKPAHSKVRRSSILGFLNKTNPLIINFNTII